MRKEREILINTTHRSKQTYNKAGHKTKNVGYKDIVTRLYQKNKKNDLNYDKFIDKKAEKLNTEMQNPRKKKIYTQE